MNPARQEKVFASQLDRHDWSYFCRFRFDSPASTSRAADELQDYLRSVQGMASGSLRWAFVVRRKEKRGEAGRANPLARGLIGGGDGLRINDIRQRWSGGKSDIRTFKPDQGGVRYVARHLLDSDGLPVTAGI